MAWLKVHFYAELCRTESDFPWRQIIVDIGSNGWAISQTTGQEVPKTIASWPLSHIGVIYYLEISFIWPAGLR